MIEQLAPVPARLIVAQPNYDRVTDQHRHDVSDLRAFCAKLPPEIRSENVPPCLGGREPEPSGKELEGGQQAAIKRHPQHTGEESQDQKHR